MGSEFYPLMEPDGVWPKLPWQPVDCYLADSRMPYLSTAGYSIVRSSSAITMYSRSNSAVWTVGIADIDANASQFLKTFYVDLDNDLLYMVVKHTSTDHVGIATINMTTGVDTFLGFVAIGNIALWGEGWVTFIDKVGDNLEIYNTNSGTVLTVVQATGALVSEDAVVQNGIPVSGIGYKTIDENLLIKTIAIGTNLLIQGAYNGVVFSINSPVFRTFPGMPNITISDFSLYDNGLLSTNDVNPLVLRVDFDAWLYEMLDTMGIYHE